MSTTRSAYDRLSPKRKAFVDLFLLHNNATKAARLAGYKKPKSEGSRLRTFADVAAALRERSDCIETKRLRTIEEYLLRLEEIAFGDENIPASVSALRELLDRRDAETEKAKREESERQARIAYIKAKTAEVAGGADELGDVLIKWEDAKE